MVIGDCAFPLEQSAARCHLSTNADCFSEPPQNLSLFLINYFLFLVFFVQNLLQLKLQKTRAFPNLKTFCKLNNFKLFS